MRTLCHEGRKPRIRKAPVYRPKETAFHMNVAKLLGDYCLPDWQWTHIGHGEKRDIRVAVKLKKMGVRKGWPDFILVPPSGKLHCLELKREGEGLTDSQEEFRMWCVRNGVPHVIAYSVDEVMIVFGRWHCLSEQLLSAWHGSITKCVGG